MRALSIPQSSIKSPLPYIVLGLGILSLSMSAMFVRWANAPGPITSFYRLFIAALIMAPFFAILWGKKDHTIKMEHIIFPVIGGVASGFDLALWSTSLSYTTASNASLIGNTAPLWVALAGVIIFRNRLKRDFWIGLILAMSGAVFIMGSDFLTSHRFGVGDLMALGSSFFYAGYYLSTEAGRKFIDTLSYTWIAVVTETTTLFFINVILKNDFTGYSSQTWLAFFGSAIFSQIIGYLSISYALGHLPASVVSPTMILQPVMTTILAIPLLGEVPLPNQLLGGIIVLIGIYLVNKAHIKTTKTESHS